MVSPPTATAIDASFSTLETSTLTANTSENKLKKPDTLGNDINVEGAYQHMLIIKKFMVHLDNLARNKDIQHRQLRATILLSTAGITDRIRGLTEFLEITNLRQKFKVKKRKYRLKLMNDQK